MTFTFINAPATFQRELDLILSCVLYFMSPVYIDEVIFCSENEGDHFYHLYNVLSLLGEAGVKLKINKCLFLKKSVEYLGHVIGPSIFPSLMTLGLER